MKTSINYLNGLRIKNTNNFEKNVIKLLPDGVSNIYLSSCGMERASGYGSYNYFLFVEINKIEIKLKEHTNSAPAFDYFTDLESGSKKYEDWVKQTVLMLLEENKERIIELITEEEEEE